MRRFWTVVAAAATGNEVLKELFMDLKIAELIVRILKEHNGGSIPNVYDAIRVILSSDDNRVVASQVFGYARKFAKLGIAEVLVDSLREGLDTSCLISSSIALKGDSNTCKSRPYYTDSSNKQLAETYTFMGRSSSLRARDLQVYNLSNDIITKATEVSTGRSIILSTL